MARVSFISTHHRGLLGRARGRRGLNGGKGNNGASADSGDGVDHAQTGQLFHQHLDQDGIVCLSCFAH